MQLPFKLPLHIFFLCRCLYTFYTCYTFISGFPYTPIIVLITFMACDSDTDDPLSMIEGVTACLRLSPICLEKLFIGKSSDRVQTLHNVSLFPEPSSPLPLFSAMGVAAEPGQKGINWSNIAVGECISVATVRVVC